MSITLPPELEERLRKDAARHGVDPQTYATRLIEKSLETPTSGASLANLFAEWEMEDYTADPDEIARRNQEFEEFKETMNRNRRDSEGANARKIFP